MGMKKKIFSNTISSQRLPLIKNKKCYKKVKYDIKYTINITLCFFLLVLCVSFWIITLLRDWRFTYKLKQII